MLILMKLGKSRTESGEVALSSRLTRDTSRIVRSIGVQITLYRAQRCIYLSSNSAESRSEGDLSKEGTKVP
jgi:hypothetical protein